MSIFYIFTSLPMVLALLTAATLLAVGPKSKGNRLLVALVLSLIANTGWALAGPIVAGVPGGQDIPVYGNLASRLVAVAGYACLVAFAIHRRQRA